LAFETLRTTLVIFVFVSPLRNVRSLAPARSASDRRWLPHQAQNALGEPGSAGERKTCGTHRLAHRIAAHGSPGVMSSRGQSQDTARSGGPLALVFALRGLGPLLLDPCSLRASLRSIEERRVGARGDGGAQGRGDAGVAGEEGEECDRGATGQVSSMCVFYYCRTYYPHFNLPQNQIVL
jgi:hypothetical protein